MVLFATNSLMAYSSKFTKIVWKERERWRERERERERRGSVSEGQGEGV